jgi:hypothetical protein
MAFLHQKAIIADLMRFKEFESGQRDQAKYVKSRRCDNEKIAVSTSLKCGNSENCSLGRHPVMAASASFHILDQPFEVVISP